jgi:hypothetical protein
MFDWLKRGRKDGKARWSQVLGARQEERFEELVNARLASEGETAVVDGGRVPVRGKVCGLENLAQLCHSLPADDWPRAIGEHFDALRRAEQEEVEWHARKHDFDWVAPQLCVRLHPAEYANADGSTFSMAELSLAREDLPGLPTVLVADRPSTVVSVERSVSDAWGRTSDEIFARALANLAEQHPVVAAPLDLDGKGGLRAWVLESEHLFGASHVLRLDAWPDVIGAHGTLVAVPTRHALIAYPIESTAVIDAISILAHLANKTFRDGPGSITPDLFWRTRDGRFERMTVVVSSGKIELTPSEGFVALMNAVAG